MLWRDVGLACILHLQQGRRCEAILTVSNLNDSGAGSLRDAIDQANATVGVEDTVEFAGFLAGHAIRLASTLAVSDALKIDGDIDNDGAAGTSSSPATPTTTTGRSQTRASAMASAIRSSTMSRFSHRRPT